MKPDGVYVYCTVEGDLPYDAFIALGQRRQREVLERGTLTEDGDARSFFFVSSLPWLHYSQLEHPMVSPDDSNPRISWGKYVTANGRTTLPVSLFVNHALADGLHISRFFRNLETELAALAESWCEDNTPKAPLVARGAVGDAAGGDNTIIDNPSVNASR